NTRNIGGALALFSDDAVVTLLPVSGQSSFRGKAEIRKWLDFNVAQNIQLLSSGHEVSGDRVRWTYQMSADDLQALGIASIDVQAEAVIQNGRIKALAITFPPDTLARREAAASSAQ